MTNTMYELQASKWEWKKLEQSCSKSLKTPPSARMCHSFTTLGGANGIPCIDKVVLFGGVLNCADNPEKQVCWKLLLHWCLFWVRVRVLHWCLFYTFQMVHYLSNFLERYNT